MRYSSCLITVIVKKTLAASVTRVVCAFVPTRRRLPIASSEARVRRQSVVPKAIFFSVAAGVNSATTVRSRRVNELQSHVRSDSTVGHARIPRCRPLTAPPRRRRGAPRRADALASADGNTALSSSCGYRLPDSAIDPGGSQASQHPASRECEVPPLSCLRQQTCPLPILRLLESIA